MSCVGEGIRGGLPESMMSVDVDWVWSRMLSIDGCTWGGIVEIKIEESEEREREKEREYQQESGMGEMR